jgi:glucuronoarabinoxylan endo-1,4-beta-xylanase
MTSTRLLLLLCAALVFACGPREDVESTSWTALSETGDASAADVSTSDAAATGATFSVNWNDSRQGIDGFGASTAFAIPFSNSVADFLWSPSLGIGLSLVRDEITPNGWPQTMTSMDSSGVPTDGDFSVLQQAVSRGAKAWGNVWAFPAPWTGGSANGALVPSHYADAANLLVTYVDRARSAGVPIYAVSIMNEPDISPSYAQTRWSSGEALSFIKSNLSPALATWATAHSSSAPLISLPETANWSNLHSWISAVESDSTAVAELGHYSTHQYYGGTAYAPPAKLSHPIWETEAYYQSSHYDPTIADGLNVARLIHRALTTGGASAWHYWFAEDVSDPNNSGLVGTAAANWSNPQKSLADWNSPTFPKRAFVMGNWAKFVRPGWVRVGVTGSKSGIYGVTAYKNPATGDFAVVIINTSGHSVTISVGLSGANCSTVTPYVTSGTSVGAIGTDGNLSAGSVSAGVSASIAASGYRFSVSIPNGVTTLVGAAH